MGVRVHPCFEIPAPNQPIVLGNEPAQMRLLQEPIEANLKAYVTCAPRLRVSFELELLPYFGLELGKETEVMLLTTGATVDCQILKGKMFSADPSTVWLRPRQLITQGALTSAISSVVFVIPNFPDFLAHSVVRELPGSGFLREDEIRLQFLNWKVTIQKPPDIAERKALLDDNGGFGITAVGVLERTDNGPFIWDDAAPQIEALRVFLSFACGRWTGPMLPAGVSATGERVWFQWSVPLVDDGFPCSRGSTFTTGLHFPILRLNSSPNGTIHSGKTPFRMRSAGLFAQTRLRRVQMAH
jgi:hypothetical protein